MSNKLVNEMRSMRLPPVPKGILWVLCDIANDEGATFGYAPLSRLIEESCYQRNAVINGLDWLESVNIITANRENGRKTTYQITLSERNVEAIEAELNRKKEASKRTLSTRIPVDQNNQLTKTTSRPEHNIPVGQKTEPVGQKTPPVDEANTNPLIPINPQKQPKKPREKIASWNLSDLVLPEFIKPELWEGFVDMRIKKRKPIQTELTAKLLIDALTKFHTQGLDQNESLRNSIANGWTDVYAPKPQAKQPVSTGGKKWDFDQYLNPPIRTVNDEPYEALSYAH